MLIFLTDRRQQGLELTRTLAASGLEVLAECMEAAEYLCREHTMSAMLIDGTAEPHHANALCAKMRSEYPDLPIALILENGSVADSDTDCVIRYETVPQVADEVLHFCRTHGWNPQLSTFTLLVNDHPNDTRLLGYRMPLSPREHQILRLIYLRAPETVSRNELLGCLLPGRLTESGKPDRPRRPHQFQSPPHQRSPIDQKRLRHRSDRLREQ